MLLMDEYGVFLRQNKNLSYNTMLSYIRDIHKYASYLEYAEIECDEASKDDIVNYLSLMQKNGQAASSVLRMMASLRSYYGFILENGMISEDPTIGLKAPKLPKREFEILTPHETELFLKQPECVNFKGYRDKAMLELIYATGIKVSELIELKTDELNINESYILCGTGEKKRIIPFGAIAKNALKQYLENARFAKKCDEENDYLFINVKGGKLSRQGFWKIIKFYKDKAKIDKEINSNTLRHSFAVHLMENGADVVSVQEMLGHTVVTSTKVYAEVINKRLHDVYKKAHPRA